MKFWWSCKQFPTQLKAGEIHFTTRNIFFKSVFDVCHLVPAYHQKQQSLQNCNTNSIRKSLKIGLVFWLDVNRSVYHKIKIKDITEGANKFSKDNAY
jgi:hypothetical protein